MTKFEQAQLLGKLDALEISRKVSELQKSRSRYSQRRFRESLLSILTTSISILATQYATSLFQEREVREEYYRSLAKYMQEVGLVREGFQYAPEGDEFVQATSTQAQEVQH